MNRGGVASHGEPLRALHLPQEAESGLGRYLDLLASWSARANLTGARTPSERVELLVAEVLPAVELLDDPTRPVRHLIDVGSGNGSPGLVLALLRPDLGVTLLEPRLKRWAFLQEAAREAARRGPLAVRRERHDQYPGAPADLVTLRGLALPLGELRRLLVAGGRVVFFGGQPGGDPGFTLERRLPLPRSEAWVFRECST